jgi:putative transcriptional regulator
MSENKPLIDFSLKGQFLVAMPLMGDERFHESVIFVVDHGPEGAMALIVNQQIEDVRFEDVLADLDLEPPERVVEISSKVVKRQVLRGGPVEKSRGFVLHSPDYGSEGGSMRISDDVHLSANLDILRAIAYQNKPKKALFALGYCGWSPGQLESELAQNAWLSVPHSAELLFDTPFESRYEKALGLMGINRASLSAMSGNA